MEIDLISARAFGKFYRLGETTRILGWDKIDNQIQLEAITIITELAIKPRNTTRTRILAIRFPKNIITCLMYSKKGNK